ncbi:MAG: heparinase, partial [Saprospirales bacterium]|nr:heparinase [Saprospirales bacterium]
MQLLRNHTLTQNHLSLMLTPESVQLIRTQLGRKKPLFDQNWPKPSNKWMLKSLQALRDSYPEGHVRRIHPRTPQKELFSSCKKREMIFQITGDEKYAVYIRDMLLEYARLFPTLRRHPTRKSYATGKIFWQCLNDANWLVTSARR